MKAFLYTLVLSAILVAGVILMQHFDVTRPEGTAEQPQRFREPIASAPPVPMSTLSDETFAEHSNVELFDTGVEFLEQWHVPEARAVFEHVIQQDSSNVRAYAKLAECHADPLFFNDARIAAALNRGRQVAAGDTLLIAAMQRLFLDADYTGSIDLLKRAVRSNGEDLGARYLLALSYYRNGSPRESQTAIEGILERDESHGRARALLVKILLETGKASEAEQLAKDLATLYPGEPYPYTLLARVQLRMGKPEDATGFGNNALNLDQRFAPAIVTRGYLYVESGEYEAARVTFEKLLLFGDPVVAAAAWESIAYVDFLAGRFDEAVEGMDEAIRLASGAGASRRAAATLYRLVNYLCELGQGDAAHATLSKWEQATGNATAEFGRLRLHIFFGDLSRASAVLAEIKASGDGNRLMNLLGIEYEELLALTFIKEKKYDQAIGVLTNAEISDTSYYFLGFASFQNGFAERAAGYFEGVRKHRLKMDFPYHGDPVLAVQSLFYLAETSLAIGRADDARRYYTSFLERWGDAAWDLQAVTRAKEKLATLAAARE